MRTEDYKNMLPPLVDTRNIDKQLDALCDSIREKVYKAIADAIDDASAEIDGVSDIQAQAHDMTPLMPDDRMLAYLSVICNATGFDIINCFEVLKEIIFRVIAIQTGKIDGKEQLALLGVSLNNSGGYMRFHDILDTLAVKWPDYKDEIQKWIAKLLAGEKYAKLIPLMVQYASVPQVKM